MIALLQVQTGKHLKSKIYCNGTCRNVSNFGKFFQHIIILVIIGLDKENKAWKKVDSYQHTSKIWYFRVSEMNQIDECKMQCVFCKIGPSKVSGPAEATQVASVKGIFFSFSLHLDLLFSQKEFSQASKILNGVLSHKKVQI